MIAGQTLVVELKKAKTKYKLKSTIHKTKIKLHTGGKGFRGGGGAIVFP